MNSSFKTKAATFILSLIFLVIIASFLLGDFSRRATPSIQDVANVNGLSISPREYKMRVSQQVEFFNQMMGGNLTQQQIEQMGIRETVLGQLIQTKMLLSYAMNEGFVLSQNEVKEEIKKLPYFQRDGKFDVGLYRGLLQSNGYSPTQFEEMISHDTLTRRIEMMLAEQKVSEGLAKDVLKFRLNAVPVEAIRVERQDIVPLIQVSDAEIKEFSDKPENQKILEELYAENNAKYNKPEEVKARHILFKAQTPAEEATAKAKAEKLGGSLTAQNFAQKAKELSEDPSAKQNSGDLGWFSRGRMVPEFEKAAFDAKVGQILGPIKTSFGYHWLYVEGKKGEEKKTLEQVKPELAKQALQKRKTQDLDKLMGETKTHLSDLLNKGNTQAIQAEKTKTNLTFFPTTEVNQYDLTVGPNALNAEEGKKVFAATPGTVLDLSTPGAIFLVKVGVRQTANVDEKITAQLKTETQAQSQLFARKLREELLKELNVSAKVVTNPSLL